MEPITMRPTGSTLVETRDGRSASTAAFIVRAERSISGM